MVADAGGFGLPQMSDADVERMLSGTQIDRIRSLDSILNWGADVIMGSEPS